MKRLCMGCMREYDDQYEVCPYCGYHFQTPPEQSYHIWPGSILENRYIVGRVLGFGGFGVTYVGWDYVMARKVAIKEYLPSEFATRMPEEQKVTVYSGDKEEQFKEGLLKTMDEAKRLARFESVPGIVQIFDCFEANGTSYIVMEFLEGMSLKKYLELHGRMDPEQAVSVVLQIASAMAVVHKEGILHRDIAPDNIYVLNPEEDGPLKVKLLDFGAARYATTKHSKSLSVIIKPGYAPEEQYRSRGDQGTWTDVYALAATLYKMLTGDTPQDAMERSVKDLVKRPGKLGVKLPRSMETALMNALNIKIQDRTQTMEEFSQELMAAEVKERTVTEDKKDLGSLPPWFLAGAAAVLAGLAVLGALIFFGVIGSSFGLGRSQLADHLVRVPNVVNHQVDEAETILAQEDLGMSRDKMVYSDEVPENMVSYQEIRENTTVERNTVITVQISKGKEKGVIPNLKGRSREEAERLLREAGFTSVRMEESMEPGLYDSVLDISQEEGSNVPLDQEIILTICVNQENQEGNTEVQIPVPSVVGIHRQEAEALLTEAGLQINWTEAYSEQPEGTVLSQTPEGGEMANQNGFVTVTVSRGQEQVYMKNVLLMTQDEAERTITQLGLTVGHVTQAYSDSIDAGKVISQSIAQDAPAAPQTAVDLVISKGPDPAKQTKAARERQAPPTQAETRPAPTQPPTEAPTQPPTEAPTQPPTEAPTQPPTEAPTQPPAASSAGAPTRYDPDTDW